MADRGELGRYESTPWKPGEEEEVRNHIRAEVAKGMPILVTTGNDLTFTFLGAGVNAKGEVGIECRVTGTLTRPNGTWTMTGETVSVIVPSTKEEAPNGP